MSSKRVMISWAQLLLDHGSQLCQDLGQRLQQGDLGVRPRLQLVTGPRNLLVTRPEELLVEGPGQRGRAARTSSPLWSARWQNFYRQTTVEFIRFDVCWFKTWCTGIFLWWQKFYIGFIVWDEKCGTVWENTVSVDFKHGVCGYFYGENLSRQ